MSISARTGLAAALVTSLVLVGCAEPSGQSWTPPPAASVVPAAPATAAPVVSLPPVATEVPAETAAPAESAAPAGEARVIELDMTAALEIKLLGGAKVTDLPVTPGETVRFKVTNSAGYSHNFWIGTDQQLMTNQVAGLPGIPDYNSGVQEFDWTVPADITGLKFGCTVPGHYSLMQGVFSALAPAEPTAAPAEPTAAPAEPTAAPAEPTAATESATTPAPVVQVGAAATEPPAASAAPAATTAPAASAAPDTTNARVIELDLTASLSITSGGAQAKEIPVTPGETVLFRVTNTAGYPHNFYIGTDAQLSGSDPTGLSGIPGFSTGTQELVWEVPADITGLKYGCTVPGHYVLMQGVFTVRQ